MGYPVLAKVWGHNKGYVFLPRRKDGKWEEGRAFEYPDEVPAIKARLKMSDEEGYDTYWCPLLFNKPKRLKENAKPIQRILWADLDEVPADDLPLKPAVAWKSSDDRYQAIWFLDNGYDIGHVEEANKQLTYAIGADKGGWDVTQVLRVPGSTNYKYSPPQKGELLWSIDTAYSLEYVHSSVAESGESKLDKLLSGWTLSEKALSLIHTPAHKVVVGERSERLWELEVLLIEAGMPIRTAIEVIKLTSWNKFAGRRDEDKQLERELLKADEHVRSRKTVAKPTDNWLVPFDTFVSNYMPPPEWLVEGVWQSGTYGMVAGEPKTYKSVLVTDLVMSVASGQPYLGMFDVPKKGTVVMFQDENSPQTIQDRVYKISSTKTVSPAGDGELEFFTPSNLPIYFSNNPGIDLTNLDHRAQIEKVLVELKPLLVVFDPLYMMLGGVDENDASEVRGVLQWLTSLRNKYGCAIIIIHHYNKSKSSARGGQNIRGTSQFHAWVECGIYVKTTGSSNVVLLEREFRSFPMQGELRVAVDLSNPGTNGYKVRVLDYDAKDDNVRMQKEMLNHLRVSSLSVKDLRVKMGVANKTIKTWLDNAINEGVVKEVRSGVRGVPSLYQYVGDDDDDEEV